MLGAVPDACSKASSHEPDRRSRGCRCSREAERAAACSSSGTATRRAIRATETLKELFEEQAARPRSRRGRPSTASALVRRAERRANRLAHRLRDARRRPGDAGRDPPRASPSSSSSAVLGVLKAGGAYVPLDPTVPPRPASSSCSRTRGPRVLLTEDHRTGLGAGRIVVLDGVCDEHPATGRETSRRPRRRRPRLRDLHQRAHRASRRASMIANGASPAPTPPTSAAYGSARDDTRPSPDGELLVRRLHRATWSASLLARRDARRSARSRRAARPGAALRPDGPRARRLRRVRPATADAALEHVESAGRHARLHAARRRRLRGAGGRERYELSGALRAAARGSSTPTA